MQGQEGHGRIYGLSALGTQAHHFQARQVDLLRQLVHGNVGWCTDQDGASGLLHQVVDNGGGGHGFTSARWAL